MFCHYYFPRLYCFDFFVFFVLRLVNVTPRMSRNTANNFQVFCGRKLPRTKKMFQIREWSLLNRESKKPEGETLSSDRICKCHIKIRKRIREILQSILSPPRIIGKIKNSLKRTPGIQRSLPFFSQFYATKLSLNGHLYETDNGHLLQLTDT